MPASSRIRATATPAAPAPEMTTRVRLGRAAGQAQRVGQRGERDHGGAVLVVVEDRDVEAGLEPLLDLEAAGRRDVLEVDPAEARREPRDGLDDLLDVGGGQADRDGVDAAELLEQHRLALHHRHRRGGPDVAEAEHRGAVGDDRDGVGHPGVVLGHAPGRRRSPRRPGRRRACRPARAPRDRSARPSRPISILPPTWRSKTGSPAKGCGLAVCHAPDPSTAAGLRRGAVPVGALTSGVGEGHSRRPSRRASTASSATGTPVARVDAIGRVVAQQPPARSRRCAVPAARRRA